MNHRQFNPKHAFHYRSLGNVCQSEFDLMEKIIFLSFKCSKDWTFLKNTLIGECG